MRISEARANDLFEAIDVPIVDLRIALLNNKVEDLNDALFRLALEIHERVFLALDIEND